MFQSKKNRTVLLFVLISILIVLIQGLFIDVTRDSGKYATIAKEIFMHGNWINLTVHGEPYLQKPPLMFWLSAIYFHLFGVSNFSFKLPLLISSLASLYFTYMLGKRLYGKQIGVIAAIVLLFSEYFLLYNMDIHTDTLLLPMVTLAIWQLAEYIQTNKIKYLVFASVGIGLAMATKGPIGAAIPIFAVGTHLLLKKDFKRLFDWRWLIGVCIVLVLIFPVLLGIYRQFGIDGIEFYFWTNNIGRVTGEYLVTNTDYFFFVHTLLYMLLPWSLFFFVATFNEFKRLFKKRFRSGEYFILGGIWIFFIIMSFSRCKLPNYIYILTPLMSVLIAKWIFFALKSRHSQIFRLWKLSQLITQIIIWVLIVVISVYIFPLEGVVIGVVLVSMAFFYINYMRKEKTVSSLFFGSVISMLALSFLLNFHVFPEMYASQAVPLAARMYNRLSDEGEKLYDYKYGQYELFFYGKDEVGLIHDQKELEQVMKLGKSWIFTNQDGFLDIVDNPTQFPYDSIVELKHAYLNKGIRYINPKSREKSKETMYLLHCN